MPLGMEVGLGPDHIVLDGDLTPLQKRGKAPNFRSMPVVAIGWMDQDVTWYRGRPHPRRHCVRWGPSSPTVRDTAAPNILAHFGILCSTPQSLADAHYLTAVQ